MPFPPFPPLSFATLCLSFFPHSFMLLILYNVQVSLLLTVPGSQGRIRETGCGYKNSHYAATATCEDLMIKIDQRWEHEYLT